MSDWRPINTAPQNGKKIDVRRGVRVHLGAYWFEGDLTAGWADCFGKPLGFEPVDWRPAERSTEARE